jgi:hypothetical protein
LNLNPILELKKGIKLSTQLNLNPVLDFFTKLTTVTSLAKLKIGKFIPKHYKKTENEKNSEFKFPFKFIFPLKDIEYIGRDLKQYF